MKVSREQAIQILSTVTDQDNWWEMACERILDLGEDDETPYPTLFDVFEALGVPKDEFSRVTGETPTRQNKPRTWAPEGDGLPPGYSHHPGISTGPYWETGHVVCRLVDGTEPHSARRIWQAVGRDSQHALELAWQHHEDEPLDSPIAVWDADDPDFENTGMNYSYPYPIAPQW